MFEGWDSYFLLTGGAAGALIGLLFVVQSLATGLDRTERLRGASMYISPIVFHFASVVVLSGVALAPRLHPVHVAALVGLCGVIGAGHLGWVTWRIASPKTAAAPHWSDLWCYGVAPLVLYLLLVAAGVAAFEGVDGAAYGIAAGTIALLLLAVRNAWDLVTWLAPGSGAPPLEDRPPANGG